MVKNTYYIDQKLFVNYLRRKIKIFSTYSLHLGLFSTKNHPKSSHFNDLSLTLSELNFPQGPFVNYVSTLGYLLELESIQFFQSKLTFSITEQVEESNLFCDTAPTSSAKFKNLKFSKNVNFEGTSSGDSILVGWPDANECSHGVLELLTKC